MATFSTGQADRPAVVVAGLCHRYGRQEVLRSLDFSIPQGTIVGLLGPSGSGKTTLIRILAGLLKPVAGTVQVAGQAVPSRSLAPFLGYMAQFDALYDDLTGLQNLMFFAALYGIRGQTARQRVAELLELVQLAGHEHKVVHQYSGGMRRRLSLAITLLHRPAILFLDEPTIGLDPLLRQDFWQEFRTLAAAGSTLVLSTHVMDEAARCHVLGMLFEGRILAWGSPAAIMARTGTTSVEEAFLALRQQGDQA